MRSCRSTDATPARRCRSTVKRLQAQFIAVVAVCGAALVPSACAHARSAPHELSAEEFKAQFNKAAALAAAEQFKDAASQYLRLSQTRRTTNLQIGLCSKLPAALRTCA